MGRRLLTVLYILLMAATVVGADVMFFQHQFWARLIANVLIVLGFAGAFVGLGGRPWSPRK